MQIPLRFLGTTIGTHIKIAKNLFEAAYIVDKEGTILYWNDAAYNITGYDYNSMIGKKCKDHLLMHFDENGKICCDSNCPVKQAIAKADVYQSAFSVRHKGGYVIPVEVRCIPLNDADNNIVAVMEVFKRKQDPEKSLKDSVVHGLVQTVYIDPITNIPNKQYIEQKIKILLSESVKNTRDVALSLLLVDVRNLADFNNYGGLSLGNLLLKIVAKTLLETVDIESGSLVARWYGGSFIVFINTNKMPVLLNWGNKLKFALDHSKVPEWEDIPIDARVYGTIVQTGETFGEITRRLEKQWSVCKEASKGVNIS